MLLVELRDECWVAWMVCYLAEWMEGRRAALLGDYWAAWMVLHSVAPREQTMVAELALQKVECSAFARVDNWDAPSVEPKDACWVAWMVCHLAAQMGRMRAAKKDDY